jgi:DNA polymerase I-like protein with 3'-5' exonuclease and polymerase domains
MLDFAHKDSKILCIQLGIIENPEKVYLIWYAKTNVKLSDTFKNNVKKFMQWVMLNKTVVAHNGSAFDIPWICTHFEIDPWKISIIDTLVLGYLARNSTRRVSLGLKDLSYKYVADYDNALDVFKKEYCAEHKLKKEEFSYDFIPKDILATYSYMDIVALNFVRKELEQECRNHKGGDLYETSFIPFYKDFSKLIAYMEVLGIPFDIKKAKEILAEKIKLRDSMLEEIVGDNFVKNAEKLINTANFKKAMIAYQKKVDEAEAKGKTFKGKAPNLDEGKYGSIVFDIKFNPNSTDHKRVLAFDVLKLPILSKTLAGLPSADGESFIKWAEMRKDISILNIFSKLAKIEKEITSFYEPYIIKAENSRDGRLRGFYRINGTISGRISMTDINILQVPRESEFKYLLGFPEDSDYYIINSDITNLEGNQLTLMSLDEGLLDIDKYAKGDGHSFLAINLANLGVDLFKELKGLDNKKIEDIKYVKEKYPQLRHFAKTANFSCIFGISGKGLARDLGIKDGDGEAIVQGFWKTHSQAKDFFDRQELKAKQEGYVDLIGGAKLLTPDADDSDLSIKSKAIRSSNNATIQSGSFVTHRAMININNLARELNLDMLPVTPWHDCCYYAVHKKDLVEASRIIQVEMERPFMENQLYPLISKPDIGKSLKGGFEVDTNVEGYGQKIRENFNI